MNRNSAATETPFTRQNTRVRGKYAYYVDAEGVEHFLARFRNAGVKSFVTHLIRFWTVESFMREYNLGHAPLTIVRTTGYLQPHIKRWLKQDGFPTTVAGYEAWKTTKLVAKTDSFYA